MKRIVSVILVFSMLILAGCKSPAENKTGMETPAEDPALSIETAAPTPAPADTSAPSDEPAATPAPSEAPEYGDFPEMPKLGRLTDGPIFPEPAKYLVLPGESNMHYVFNNMGELLGSFAMSTDEETEFQYGFFGEDGICCWHRLSDFSEIKPLCYFNDFALRMEYAEPKPGDWEHGRWELTELLDSDLNTIAVYKKGEISFGKLGGIMRFDGGYLVVAREYGFTTMGKLIQLDKNGRKIGEIDPTPFGMIFGVFGDKYIIRMRETNVLDEDTGYYTYKYDILSIEGRVLMTDVEPVVKCSFLIDYEIFYGGLASAYYLKSSSGTYYDSDLKPIPKPSDEELEARPVTSKYGIMYLDGYRVHDYGVYYGVTDDDGNWLFRIYNPQLVSDHPLYDDEYEYFEDDEDW
ncbi:MAG: hypothetical protein IJM18_03290 [Clostridia bacterium]|nr:hypothetical protein [Clostridia bacterium]